MNRGGGFCLLRLTPLLKAEKTGKAVKPGKTGNRVGRRQKTKFYAEDTVDTD